MQPEINLIKAKYYGNGEKISEEQYELYKREHYQPLADLIPLALQLILLMGVIDVINHPEQHISRNQACLTLCSEVLTCRPSPQRLGESRI